MNFAQLQEVHAWGSAYLSVAKSRACCFGASKGRGTEKSGEPATASLPLAIIYSNNTAAKRFQCKTVQTRNIANAQVRK